MNNHQLIEQELIKDLSEDNLYKEALQSVKTEGVRLKEHELYILSILKIVGS